MEIYKDIIGYEGIYQISNLGNVKTIKTGLIRKQVKRKCYFHVHLCKKCKYKSMSIHRLLAIHFIPNTLNKPIINHINGIREDNRLENLEWCTYSENTQHAYDIGLKKVGAYHIKRIKEVNSKKVINTDTKEIYVSVLEASKSTIYSYSHVLSMLNGSKKNKTNLKQL